MNAYNILTEAKKSAFNSYFCLECNMLLLFLVITDEKKYFAHLLFSLISINHFKYVLLLYF